jgi:acetolactate synthase-1/3 small subunit
VLKVQDVTDESIVEHEFALIKVRATKRSRPEIVSVAEMHRAKVVDLGDEAVIVEAVGEPTEIDTLVELLREFGIKELVRTGSVVMARGSGSIEEQVKR